MKVSLTVKNDLLPSALASAAAGGLWLALASVASDQVLGVLQPIFRAAALVATGLAAVLVLERVLLAVLFPPSLGRQATGVQRVVTFAALGLPIGAATMSRLGIDPRTVLATAAVATAAIGIALQSTICNIFAGLNLQLEAKVRVGDRIDYGGAPLTITAMNWRTVSGRRNDGALVIITNVALADSAVSISGAEKAAQLRSSIYAPIGLPPAQLRALIVDLLLDLPAIDIAKAMTVTPSDIQASSGVIVYQVGASLRPQASAASAQGELLGRLWYVYQRHNIAFPGGWGADGVAPCDGQAWATPQVLALLKPFLREGPAERPIAERLAPGCELLMYGPGERLTAPERTLGRRFMALSGRAAPERLFGPSLQGDGVTELGLAQRRRVAAAALGGELSALIGPYGDYAARLKAGETDSAGDLRRRVAEEIANDAKRQAFLAAGHAEPDSALAPGDMLDAGRDPFGGLTCGQNLRALSEVLILALPRSAAGAAGQATGKTLAAS